MPIPAGMSFADFCEQMAKKAGLPLEQKTNEFVTVVFKTGESRYQRVWIRPFGTDYKERQLIAITSPAMVLSKGQQLSQKVANELLKDNCKLAHGAWAIQESDKEDYLIAIDSLIADTMEPEELESSAGVVAMLADEMEARLNVDTF